MPDMPGFMRRPRYRRTDDAPRIEAAAGVQVMSRRVESFVSRDCSFGVVTRKSLFRSAVKLSRTVYAYERKSTNGKHDVFTAASLEAVAVQIAKEM